MATYCPQQPSSGGTTRALLVGINYENRLLHGQSLRLNGCCNDVHKMRKLLADQGPPVPTT
eukprot:2421162-Pyramimonas_sp.AAC.1